MNSQVKFKTLVHYIIHQCRANPEQLGSIRLNKALWYADVIAYQLRGNPITGATYIKRERGPVPKSVVTTLRKLKSEGKISVKEPQYAFDVRRFFSLTDGVDTSAFTDEELGIADAALGAVCATTANRISEMTHDLIWEAAGMGEEIPLYATLAANKGVVSVETMAWAVKESKAWVAQRNAQLQPA